MLELSRVTVSGAVEGEYLIREACANGILEIVPVPNGDLPTVVSLRQTCSACPSQWEGQLEDGRWLYARYRWGGLRVGLAETLDEAVSAYGDEALYERQCGDDLDGCMDTAELRRELLGLLHFPDDLEVTGEPKYRGGISPDWLKAFESETPKVDMSNDASLTEADGKQDDTAS